VRSADLSPRLEGALSALLRGGVVLSLALSFAAVFLLTLSVDEAWILLGIQPLLEGAGSSPYPMAPAATTGGLHTLVEAAITSIAGHAVWPQRLFPFVSLMAIVGLLLRWARFDLGSWAPAWLVPAPLLALPGTLVLAATAHGAVPVFLLVLVTIAAWEKTGGRRVTRWMVCGLLLGLVAATRVNCAVIFPALLVCAWVRRSQRPGVLLDAAAVCAIGGAVLLANFWILGALTPADAAPKDYGAATGLGFLGLDWRILGSWVVGASFLPIPLMVLATAVSWRIDTRGGPLWILTTFGWLLFGAWLIVAPEPHLRYLWPGMASFAVVLGLGLARSYQWAREEGQPLARASALAVALACVVAGLGTTTRHVAYGDLTLITAEWSRWKGLDPVPTGRWLSHQRAAVRYLEEWSPPDETVAALGYGLDLRYLSDRPLFGLGQLVRRGDGKPEELPRRLVLTPVVGSFVFLRPAGVRWFQENTRLDARVGGYSFYRVTGTYPRDPMAKLVSWDAHRHHPVPR
jgi:hypothetical protein